MGCRPDWPTSLILNAKHTLASHRREAMGDGSNATSHWCCVLALVSSVHAEEATTYTCTKHTLHECLLELPCDSLKKEPDGDIVVSSGVKIRLAGTLEKRDFSQRDFNRAAEEKCGKLQ